MGIMTGNKAQHSKWQRSLAWLIFLGFVIVVQWTIGWQTLLQPWFSLNPQQLALALLSILATYSLRTWRIYDYFPQLKGQWLATWRLMLLHNALNNLLPARTGEVSFPLLMQRYFQLNYTQTITALLWFRLLDLHTILTLGLYPLLSAYVSPLTLHSLLILWLSLPIGLYKARHTLSKYPFNISPKLNHLYPKILAALPQTPKEFISSIVFTWLNWLIKLLTLAWLFSQFLPNLPYVNLLLSIISAEFTSILPIHAPGGFGTYEAGLLPPLLQYSRFEPALNAAINLHIFILGTSLIGGAIGLFIPHKTQLTSIQA
jgi:hypothetical protein